MGWNRDKRHLVSRCGRIFLQQRGGKSRRHRQADKNLNDCAYNACFSILYFWKNGGKPRRELQYCKDISMVCRRICRSLGDPHISSDAKRHERLSSAGRQIRHCHGHGPYRTQHQSCKAFKKRDQTDLTGIDLLVCFVADRTWRTICYLEDMKGVSGGRGCSVYSSIQPNCSTDSVLHSLQFRPSVDFDEYI